MPQTPRTRADARAGRSKRRSGRRRMSWPKRIGLTFLGLVLLGLAVVGVAYAMTDIPEPNERATQQASTLYYSDGKTVLDRVAQVVKVVGFVASAPGFGGQPGVINGASELLGEVFGDAGAHARSAVGVAELPLGSPVEVELIVRVAE